MCQFFSAVIVDKGKKVLWLPDSDSHADILEHYKIKDTELKPNFVKIEFIPPEYTEKAFKDLSSWKLKIDQDCLPDWFTKIENHRHGVEQAASAFIKERVFFEGRRLVTNGRYFAFDSSTVWAYGSSTVRAFDSSAVWAYGSSAVWAYDSSTVRAYGSATVWAYDFSTVRAYGSSTIKASDSSTVWAYDSSTVRAYSSSTIIWPNKSLINIPKRYKVDYHE